jgi:hypothetical protein
LHNFAERFCAIVFNRFNNRFCLISIASIGNHYIRTVMPQPFCNPIVQSRAMHL